MDNPNIVNNECIYRSQIREFFEGRFGAFMDEGHYINELNYFRGDTVNHSPGEIEQGDGGDWTTCGNYGSFDTVYATKLDVIIGFVEYWLTGGYQKYNRHNKYIIAESIPISSDTDFAELYGTIEQIDDDLTEIATKEYAMKIVLPNWLKIDGYWTFTKETIGIDNMISLEYSFDGITWNEYSDNIMYGINSAYIRGNNINLKNISISELTNGIGTINPARPASGYSISQLYISGSVQSLIYGDDTENQYIICDYCFRQLFSSNKIHINNINLPAIYLKPYCYCEMFYSTLVNVIPELPATTLAEGCYSNMFENCTSLTSINPLPATTLATSCYERMFYNCTSLNISETRKDEMFLPATKMAERCYTEMFRQCSALEYPPMLPAYKLATSCYAGMFGNCSSLKIAPELPAIELEPDCYDWMFANCTSLQVAPELPAKKLTQQCYSYMFSYCTNLKYVKALFTELTWGGSNSYVNYAPATNSTPHCSIRGWLYNTNTNSSSKIVLHTDFLTNKLYENINVITGLVGSVTSEWVIAPTNWQIYGTRNYLHFKPVPSTTNITNCQSWKVTIHKAAFNDGNPTYNDTETYLHLQVTEDEYDVAYNASTGNVDYSTNVWGETIDGDPIEFTFGSGGLYIKGNEYIYANRNEGWDIHFYNKATDTATYRHQHFLFTPLSSSAQTQYIDIFGDLRSIYFNEDDFEEYDDLPNLSRENRWDCYSNYSYMFISNPNIRHIYTSAPIKTFHANMYEASFMNCTNLIYLPNLGTDPSLALNYGTFNCTFQGCINLEYAPELPYLTYSDEDYTRDGADANGYSNDGNSHHYTYPVACYNGMFYACKSLKYIPNILPLRHLNPCVYNVMFNMWADSNISSELHRMPEIIGVAGEYKSCFSMFAYGDLYETQCLPITSFETRNGSTTSDIYASMFAYNYNLKNSMHILPALTLGGECYDAMFVHCYNLTLSPKIQGTTLATGQTGNGPLRIMFWQCRNLGYINTSFESSTPTPFNTTGNYTSMFTNPDISGNKKGALWIHANQFTGVSHGYYRAALIQYSNNPEEPGTIDCDYEYWIYIKSRKFANGNTYYIWRKYCESGYGSFNDAILTTSNVFNSSNALYVITKESIIPECVITSFSQVPGFIGASSNPKEYTVVGYMWSDFDFDMQSEEIDYTEKTHNDSVKRFLKVVILKFDEPGFG